MPSSQARRSRRSLARRAGVALLAASTVALWLAAFDAPPASQAASIAVPPPGSLTGTPRGSITVLDDPVAALGDSVRSSVVAEYAPIAIDSLPLHPGAAEADEWTTTSSGLTLVTEGELRRGQTLSGALRSHGIPSATVHLITREMRGVFDFRHAQPGHRFRLAQDADGVLLDFRYTVTSEKAYRLYFEGTRYVAHEERAPLRTEVAKIAGVVDRSLFEAIEIAGESISLASAFAEIFAWDIDFSRTARSGDHFQILYERLYRTHDDGREVYVRPGRILAARYHGMAGDFDAVYYEAREGEGGYYRADGTAMRKAFLVAPLEYRRISSTFSGARRHPILGVTRPHRGVDYAAARGAPVWSVADGTVIHKGWAGGNGNLVKIRHRSGYVSYYAHLSRFASNLKVGDRVTQKQVIGYVGSTGLATGPHVCFRIQKNDRYVNPLDIVMPAAEPIARAEWPAFRARRDLLFADLGRATLAAADEAL